MEAILINTSGGMTGGEEIGWNAEISCGATMTVTTQASEKIYRAQAAEAIVSTRLRIGRAGTMNWLPQETILFNGARLVRTVEAELDEDARLLLCEPVILGRTGRGEQFLAGWFEDRWHIRVRGHLVHLESMRMRGDLRTISTRAACLNHCKAFATILLVCKSPENRLTRIRDLLSQYPSVVSGVSAMELSVPGARYPTGKLLARLAASDGYELRKALVPLLRMLNEDAQLPKSWSL